MDVKKYSEQDIQDYASGIFAGDKSDFEEYLKHNPAAAIQVKEYQKLYGMLSLDKTPSLSFHLADRLIAKIEEKKSAKELVQFRVFAYVQIFFAAGALFFSYRHLNVERNFASLSELGVFLLSAVAMVLFSVIFYRIEMKQREKHFGL